MIKHIVVMQGMLILLILAACQSQPPKEYILGERLMLATFDDPDSWEQYQDDIAHFRPDDGAYRMTLKDNLYAWGQNAAVHTDVVIEVETGQLSEFQDNGYGLVCRADEDNSGDGYYFFISGDGYYAIGRSEGNDLIMLVEWQESDIIQKGRATNTIRAVCIDDYLGLWVNGKFMAETKDSVYRHGVTAMTVAVNGEGGDIDVAFDNLQVWAATLK